MKRVYGSYMQSSDAIEAVEDLKTQGYNRDQIRVVSIKDCGKDILVDDSPTTVKDERSLWEKFRDIYTYSDYRQDYWNTYVENDDVLKTYKSNLENGEILVLVDADELIE